MSGPKKISSIPLVHTTVASQNVIRPRHRIVETYRVIWVDATIDPNNEYCDKTLRRLHEVISDVSFFKRTEECIRFLNKMDGEKAFIITSGSLGQQLVNDIHEMSQVDVIYIFCRNKAFHEQWVKEWPKIRGVFTSSKPLCKSLKNVVRETEHDSIPMSFVSKQEIATTYSAKEKNLDQLDPTYMYSVISKNIILEIHDDDKQMEALVTYCQKSKAPVDELNDFQRRYQHKSPVWWYTKEMFLYRMLNKALRTLDTKGMVKMGFFIRHLHLQLERFNKEQEKNFKEQFTVYRGQGLSKEDFQNLVNTKDGLFSFNNFLSTSKVRRVADDFVQRAMAKNVEIVSVIFIMTTDPTKMSTSATPYAMIDEHSAVPTEQEILFTIHTVFRVREIKSIGKNNHLYEVQLTTTGDNDPELTRLTDYINGEVDGYGWYRMSKLMLAVGDFNQSEELCNDLLENASTVSDRSFIYHHLGLLKYHQGKYEEAVKYYEESLKIKLKSKPEDDTSFANTYNNIGLVYRTTGDYSKALEYYEKSLKITEKALPPTHSDLATFYNNIGAVFNKMNEYSKALEYNEKSLKIREKILPPTHPDLASSYNNTGQVYHSMGDYSKTLEYYEKSLKIREKALPPTHPDLTSSYNNIGILYSDNGEYSKALEYYEKSHRIYKKNLSPNHPNLAKSYNNMGQVYYNLGDYKKALELHERSHRIWETSLPAGHSDLAYPYNWFGKIYRNMRDYSKALENFDKCFAIWRHVLPEKHPLLAKTFSNFGDVHRLMGNYEKALTFHQKALNIQENVKYTSLDSATTYTYLGETYREMKDYSTALNYYQKGLKIREEKLPKNHPDLAEIYHDMSKLYFSTREYNLAMKNIQQAVEIAEEKLPSNHPNLLEYRETFDKIYKKK